MTRKPNFARFMLGVTVLALLFIGTWAATTARLTSAKRITTPSSENGANSNPKNSGLRATTGTSPNLSVPVATPVPVRDVFELDGNAVDDPANPLDDWSTLNSGGGSAIATTLDSNGDPVEIPDLDGQTIFTTGGSKDDLDVSNWRHKAGSSPPKDEITNAYAAAYQSGTDTYVVFGADRYATTGDAVIGFWFFQNAISLVETGPLAGTFDGVHADGDILILSDFTNGGGEVTIRVFQWNGPGGSIPGTGLINGTLDLIGTGFGCASSPLFCAEVNTVATASPWDYDPKAGPDNIFPVGSFFEGGVNLSQLGISNVCFSSFLAETRSSTSIDATLKDFVTGTFTLVPDIDAGVGAELTCTDTSVTLTATSSLQNASFHWEGPTGGIVGDPDLATIEVDEPGTYTVTITGGTGCTNSDTVEVTQDITPPDVEAGPTRELTCSTPTATLSGSSTAGTSPQWVASNGGNIVSGANTFTPLVNAAGTYTLTVTDPDNGCPASDFTTVTADNAPPTVSLAKTAANSLTQAVTVTATASSNALPAGALSYQLQSCVANCGLNASWSNSGGSQAANAFSFSNFALDTAESISFSIAGGNGAGNYEAQLWVVSLRVIVTDAGNGCQSTSNPVVVKKLAAVDP